MQSYESKKPAYFATPSPQLVRALHTALVQLLSPGPPTSASSSASDVSGGQVSTADILSARFAAHRTASHRVKAFIDQDLGLRQLADRPENQANGMTAFYIPDGLQATDILPKLATRGVVIAAGLHKDIKTRYLRIGHMGISVVCFFSCSFFSPSQSYLLSLPLLCFLTACSYKIPLFFFLRLFSFLPFGGFPPLFFLFERGWGLVPFPPGNKQQLTHMFSPHRPIPNERTLQTPYKL